MTTRGCTPSSKHQRLNDGTTVDRDSHGKKGNWYYRNGGCDYCQGQHNTEYCTKHWYQGCLSKTFFTNNALATDIKPIPNEVARTSMTDAAILYAAKLAQKAKGPDAFWCCPDVPLEVITGPVLLFDPHSTNKTKIVNNVVTKIICGKANLRGTNFDDDGRDHCVILVDALPKTESLTIHKLRKDQFEGPHVVTKASEAWPSLLMNCDSHGCEGEVVVHSQKNPNNKDPNGNQVMIRCAYHRFMNPDDKQKTSHANDFDYPLCVTGLTRNAALYLDSFAATFAYTKRGKYVDLYKPFDLAIYAADRHCNTKTDFSATILKHALAYAISDPDVKRLADDKLGKDDAGEYIITDIAKVDAFCNALDKDLRMNAKANMQIKDEIFTI